MHISAVIQKATLILLVMGCSATNEDTSAQQRNNGRSAGAAGGQDNDGGINLDRGDPLLPVGNEEDAGPEDPNKNKCDTRVVGLLRDFSPTVHPDFEGDVVGSEKGIVQTTLGPDRKPVFASGAKKTVTSAERFDQWYRDSPNINTTIEHTLEFERDPETGRAVFDSDAFFPLDDKGFGNEGNPHNYHFTFELHMEFDFRGDEVFKFKGDDDVFVFINNQQVIDLGGVHPVEESEIDLGAQKEALGLIPGETYPIDFFHAERHTFASNFRIESTLDFSNCTPILIR